MAIPGPTDRVYVIDDNSGTPQTVTALIVGEPSGVGEIEESMSDLTGPASTAPVFLPGGFSRNADMVFVFQADVGGSIDPTTIFHVNRGTSRTITVTFASGWTAATEAYVMKTKPGTPVEGKSTLEVTFRPTGAQTIT